MTLIAVYDRKKGNQALHRERGIGQLAVSKFTEMEKVPNGSVLLGEKERGELVVLALFALELNKAVDQLRFLRRPVRRLLLGWQIPAAPGEREAE